ncbi:MAG: hypothetical protein ABI369_06345 [Acetobacteraceae bacterium]
MTRLLGAAIWLAAMSLGTQAHAQGAMTLKSVPIELPFGDRTFPAGPNVDIVSNNCAACHSVGMVLYQPALSKAVWESEVHKMIDVYKAPIAADDVPKIVEYLAAIKGAR